MPGLDGTGPAGRGSRTGRRQGNCGGDNTVESRRSDLERRIRFKAGDEHEQNFGLRRGIGRSRGMGRGNKNRGSQI